MQDPPRVRRLERLGDRNRDPHDLRDRQRTLAHDYLAPRYHISLLRAVGRRLRNNYVWILLIQTIAYFGKIIIHPTPVASVAELLQRAAVRPVPGELMVVGGVLYDGTCIAIALTTLYLDHRKHGAATSTAMG